MNKKIKTTTLSSHFLQKLGLVLLAVSFITLGSFALASILSDEVEKPAMASLNQEFIEFQKSPTSFLLFRYTTEGNPLGLLPSPHDVSYFKYQPRVKVASLPSSYDLRQTNKLTPVRNQGSCGSCWAFATYGSLESFLLPSQLLDFSEQHLIDTHGYDWGPCDGGNLNMATAYLARWSGPLREEDDPYIYAQTEAVKHTQEVIMVPPRTDYLDNDLIKQAVMTYGAVYTTMYWDSSCYNPTYKSYYNPGSPVGGHAVAIVGWDDNFDQNKFTSVPPGNGAFIVRNSWGTSWGDGGYFYVSYYDEYFGRGGFNAVIKAESSSNYQTVYQYDPLGWVSSWGYGANTAWMANIFTAISNLPIYAVSFYTPVTSNAYEIYIYRDVTPDQPRSGELVATKTGQINSPGYFTVQLDNSVSLLVNQKFSVVLKLTTPGYNYPIAGEGAISGYSSQATANPLQSFVSDDGNGWLDFGANYGWNVCLKAFAGYPPLYPPVNLAVNKLENSFIFFKEYINRLTWAANPNNLTRIVNYKIHRKGVNENKYESIGTSDPSEFSYDDRGLHKTDVYSYQVTAIDEYNRESDPVTTGNTSTTTNKLQRNSPTRKYLFPKHSN